MKIHLKRKLDGLNSLKNEVASMADRIILYILRVSAVVTALKLLVVLPVYKDIPNVYSFAVFSFIVSIAITVYLFVWHTKIKILLNLCLFLFTIYISYLMFFSPYMLSLITFQHMFLVIMLSFYGLNRIYGITYGMLFLVQTMIFLYLQEGNLDSFHLFPENVPILNIAFIVIANFFLICFIHYYYNLGLNRSLKEIQKLNNKLNTSLNAKSEFLSTMSHELRTPLNSVIGTAYLLSNTEMNEEQRKNLHNLKFSAESILVLINDILDYSKMDSNHTKLESISFSLSKQLRNISKGFEPKALNKSLKFSVEIDPELDNIMVLGDPGRFSQIIYNVLGNALKFTEEGSVSIRLKVEEKTEENIKVKISIDDTGIGIAPEIIPSLFQPFTQANSSINRKYGGTGLGLAIVDHLVKLHNGTIEYEGNNGMGSSFRITLTYPISDIQILSSKLTIPNEQGIHDYKIVEDDLSSLKVLLAEDNEMAILFMKQLLKKWNITPTIAKNGEEAVMEYVNEPFDLILMDIHMPKMNGKEATLKIREIAQSKNRKVYIIALTASVSDAFAGQYQAAGFDDYLKKPFKPNDLLEKIQKGHLGFLQN